jgi:hypothetical protein
MRAKWWVSLEDAKRNFTKVNGTAGRLQISS